jgi:hypothetical protein
MADGRAVDEWKMTALFEPSRLIKEGVGGE